MSLLSWLANIIIFAGLWYSGTKKWWACGLSVVGEIMWTVVAIYRDEWDLAIVCIAFAMVGVRNLFLWRAEPAVAPVLES